MNSNNTSNKPKVLFTNFSRLEKILFFQFDYSEDFEVVGIVSDVPAKNIIEFLKYDDIHGKSSTDKFVIVNGKKEITNIIFDGVSKMNLKIIPSNLLNKSLIKKMEINIIVDFSNEKNNKIAKFNKLDNLIFVSNNVKSLSSIKEKQINCYGLKHEKINFKNNNLIVIPNIESTLINLITNKLNLNIEHINFDIIEGPKNGTNIMNTVTNSINEKFEFSRSVINNIIPSFDNSNLLVEETINLLNNKVTVSGNISYIPVTTGSLMNLTIFNKDSSSVTELNKLIKENIDSLIGYTNDKLVAKDIVSTDFYGIIEKNLIKCNNKKNTSICNISVWFDYETSFVISVFKTIQYIVGMGILKKND